MPILAAISIVLLVFGAGIFLLLRRVMNPRTVAVCDPQWLSEFSVTKYLPMQRLLDDSDARYLASQSCCNPKMLRRLRSERRRIFRSYLRTLISDFNRLHMAARMVLLYSTTDRPELVSALFRQRLMFSVAVVAIECRLVLHALGLSTVNVSGLISTLDGMRVQVSQLAPSASAA